MSEENTNNSQAPGPGDIIRYARDQRGMTPAELADEMRISRGKLEDLENNQFAAVGADTFVRGYLRSSARILKLNGDELMAEYEAFCGLTSAAEVVPAKVVASDIKLAKWQLAVIALVLLIFLGFLLSLLFGGEDSAAEPVAVQSLGAVQPAEAVVGHKPGAEELSQTGAALLSANQTVLSAGSGPAAEVENVAQGDERPVDNAENESPNSAAAELTDSADFNLLFAFTGRCWLEVRDNSGRRLFSGNKNSGDSLSLNGRGPFQIRLGNAEAVSLQVNGKDYPIQTRSGSNTLKLMVP